MKFLFNASGANAPLIKEYDIASDFSVSFGEVVGMADSLVTKAGDGDFIIGVSQEEHTGEHDELNSRSDGTKIRINIAPDAVYEVPLPSYTAKSGTATTIVTDSSGLSTSLTSGYALLLSKGAGSANTDNVGTKRRISSCSVSGSTATITVAEGGTVSEGDVYLLIPDIGDEMYLDTSKTGAVFYNADSTVKLIAVCADSDRGTLGVKIKTHFLG